MTGLAEWLLDQVKTDEAIAMVPVMAPRDAVPPWGRSVTMPDGTTLVQDDRCGYVAQVAASYALHVATFDRRRMLAECDAKRRIIERHRGHARTDVYTAAVPSDHPEHRPEVVQQYCDTLLALASVYAGRPGWRDEWAL